MVLMYFLSIRLGVLPVVTNADLGQSIILPTLTLAISMAAKYTRQVRATVLEELNKGLCDRSPGKRDPQSCDHLEECNEGFHADDHHTAGAVHR
mgnify:FL=1